LWKQSGRYPSGTARKGLRREVTAVKKLSILSTVVGALLATAATAFALGYLHVYTAQNYAAAHVWRTFCGSNANTCPSYPTATGWYDRITNNYVRVEIRVRSRSNGNCTRVLAVRGDDDNPYITSDGSFPYYMCT
jgi:hypothetical protein